MAKFQKGVQQEQPEAPHPSLAAGKPIAAEEKNPESPVATEATLVVTQNNEMQREFQDINSDGTKHEDKDQPSTKDFDYATHANQVQPGVRQYMSDGLTRQLNCTMYLLDVQKDWGANPLGGRPVPVMYSREFPEVKMLYDTFGASPETNARESVEKMVEFKRKLAHAHGYRYIFQHNWEVLTSDNLTKQLDAEDNWLKAQKK